MILLAFLLILSAAGITASIVTMSRDGYRAVPLDHNRVLPRR